MHATRGCRPVAFDCRAISFIRSSINGCDETLRPDVLDITGAWRQQPPDIGTNVGERIRLQRDHPRSCRQFGAEGSFHVVQADCTYFALRLRDDMGGLQPLQHILEYLVNAFRAGQRRFDALVDFLAIAMDVETRGSTDRQPGDFQREIAFMGPAYLEFAQPEGVDHFSGAGNQRDNTHASRVADGTVVGQFEICSAS